MLKQEIAHYLSNIFVRYETSYGWLPWPKRSGLWWFWRGRMSRRRTVGGRSFIDMVLGCYRFLCESWATRFTRRR